MSKYVDFGSFTFLPTSFIDFKKRLKSLDPDKTAIILVSFYGLRDGKKNHVDYKVVDQWVYNKTNLIDLGTAQWHSKRGRLISLAIGGERMSELISEQVFKALSQGKSLSDVKIIRKIPLQLTINQLRAKKIDVRLPIEILSYAEANHILNRVEK